MILHHSGCHANWVFSFNVFYKHIKQAYPKASAKLIFLIEMNQLFLKKILSFDKIPQRMIAQLITGLSFALKKRNIIFPFDFYCSLICFQGRQIFATAVSWKSKPHVAVLMTCVSIGKEFSRLFSSVKEIEL